MMSNKSIILGSIAITGLFAILFLVSPAFSRFGYGPMMGRNYNQNQGTNGCPMLDKDNHGQGNYNGNGRGMMNGNNYNVRGMMGNWR